jgi:hypothetical protein
MLQLIKGDKMGTRDISMKISRIGGQLVGVSMIMPTWLEERENGSFSVKLPLLGDIQSYAQGEEDVTIAVNEIVELFCLAAEKFGKGLEKELEMLGWEKVSPKAKNKTVALLRYKSNNSPVFDSMAQTGMPTALSFDFNQFAAC